MSTANVRSTDAIKQFRMHLVNFAEEARNALTSTEMEIRQVRNWLERDQLPYWRSQIKKCREMVSMARTELHRRQLSQSNSDAVSDTEQREALREAQRRLREAEEKVDRIKRWLPVLEHAVSEYHSQAQPLGDRLAGGFVATLIMLDKTIAALDSYLAMAPPTTVATEPPKATSGAAAGEAEAPSAGPAPPAHDARAEVGAEPRHEVAP
ncbi:MAG TPA: hypothetical protein VKP69_17190 [Isosphaeraceae bacterium]|nr:hypothetical protein [Isosphaeraceae bacterium]